MTLQRHEAPLPYGPAEFFLDSPGASAVSFLRPSDIGSILKEIDTVHSEHTVFPWWAEHWPAADVLIRWLTSHPFPKGTHVVEFGAGLGVVGVLCALQGAAVVSLDICARGCRYAASNARRHALPVRTVCSDWNTLPFRARFDAVTASDVLYEEKNVDDIIRALSIALVPQGRAIIADPVRPPWRTFLASARKTGFAVTIVHTEKTCEGGPTVEIAELTLSERTPL